MHKSFIILLLFFSVHVSSQELLAEVTVDYSQVQASGTTIYTTLENSLRDFINTTKWTDRTYKIHEKIECNFSIIINSKEAGNRYNASILVQSRRPVFGSSYYSPILNINDTSFDFEYTEYEQLIFNERKFSNKNLTDAIGYYVYLILGYDADTFKNNGGTDFFNISLGIANNAASSNFRGWTEMDSGPRSRIALVKNITGPKNNVLRSVYYNYHRKGLDEMGSKEVQAKNAIAQAILSLETFQKQNNYSQNYPLDIFFQAKKAEIADIYSGGLPTTASISKITQLLNTLSPTNSAQWSKIQN